MRYSILTPTILRPSLVRACESINTQTCTDWEHIVIIDGVEGEVPKEIEHPQRKIIRCARNHNDYGNTCRYEAWTHLSGDYIYNLDDDNYLADERVLETLKLVTAPWAIFPINKIDWHGLHFCCPPKRGFTDTGSFIVRRDIGRWPQVAEFGAFGADGEFAEYLLARYAVQALLIRPLMIYTGVNPDVMLRPENRK